jgi:hypothetical protein
LSGRIQNVKRLGRITPIFHEKSSLGSARAALVTEIMVHYLLVDETWLLKIKDTAENPPIDSNGNSNGISPYSYEKCSIHIENALFPRNNVVLALVKNRSVLTKQFFYPCGLRFTLGSRIICSSHAFVAG